MLREVKAMAQPLDASKGAPAEMVYIPDGKNTISASVNGKPSKVTVHIRPGRGKAVAAALQAALDKRVAAADAGEGPRPWFDFDHKPGPKSAEPISFRYEEGKGIIVAQKWSTAGKQAVEASDDLCAEYDKFSPNFLIGDDDEPAGLPEKGAYGGLVNEPAFRGIPSVKSLAASDAEDPTEPYDTMNPLVTCGLLSETEAAKPDALDLAKRRVSAMSTDSSAMDEKDKKIAELTAALDALKKEKEDAEVAAAEAAKKSAENLVAAACADGRIAPQDEKAKGFYTRAIAAGDADAVDMLAALPKRFNPTSKVIDIKAADQSAKDDDKLTPYDRVEAAFAAEAEAAK